MNPNSEVVNMMQEPERELLSAFADLHCGILLADPTDRAPDPRLESLAAAAPELFASDRADWEFIFGHFTRSAPYAFQHIVLVSRERVHVAIRCNDDPSIALIAVAPRNRSVGSIVAEARSRLLERTGGSV